MAKQIVAMPSRDALLRDQTACAALDLAAEVGSSAGDCGGAKLARPQSEATASRRGDSDTAMYDATARLGAARGAAESAAP